MSLQYHISRTSVQWLRPDLKTDENPDTVSVEGRDFTSMAQFYVADDSHTSLALH